MQRVKTFCRICEAQCGLTVSIEDNAILAIEPNTEHVSSRGYACIKGLRMADFVNSPDRLTRPLKRVDGDFVPISWEQALGEIADKLNTIEARHGGEAIAGHLGNPIGFSMVPTMMMTFLLKAFGSNKLFTPGTQDCASKFAGGELLYGGCDQQTFPDIDHCQALIVIGSNPLISKSSFITLPNGMDRIKGIEQRGGKVWWLDPRCTESARRCGEHVAIRPDTDIFFLLGFLNEVLRRGTLDLQRIARHMNGFEVLAKIAADWPIEKVAEVTRVSVAVHRRMVEDYLAADGAALFHSTGVNQGSAGLLCYWIQEAINAVSGNLDKRGGVLAGKGVLPAAPRRDETLKSRIAGVPYVNSTVPGALLADEILEPGEGRVRALINMSGNPLLSYPDSRRTAEALKDLELLVCLDIVRNETAEHAHYVLPGVHSLERADIPFYFFTVMGLMPERWFGYTDAVVAPPGEAREESLILRQICHRAGRPLNGSRLFSAVSRWSEWWGHRFSTRRGFDVTLLSLLGRAAKLGGVGKLRKHPDGIRLPPNQPGDFLGQRVATGSGKVELAPAALVQRATTLEERFQRELSAAAQFKLIQRRERFTHNSWSHNVRDFVKGRDRNYLYMHPEDAAEKGLAEGAQAKVSTGNRAVEIAIKFDPQLMRGVVSIPHGWGHQSAKGLSVARNTGGVNVNELLSSGPDAIEPISGMAHMNGVLVEVAAV